jgi:hypothetical protein
MRPKIFLFILLMGFTYGDGTVSPLKSAFFSLIVPGSGEYILGAKSKAYMFFALESSLLLSIAGFTIHKNSLVDDYRIFAFKYADADFERRDEEYWSAVELYISRASYMESLYREARRIYPDDPDKQREYVESRAVSGEWSWPNKGTWFRFQDMRKAVRVTDTRIKVTLGLLIVNHIASALDTFISARLKKFSLSYRFQPEGLSRIGLQIHF